MDIRFEVLQIDVGDGVEIDLNKILPITGDLSREFTNQASLYAWVAVIAARAEAIWLEAKREMDRIYAELDPDVRRDFLLNGVKVTETSVKSEILCRKGYIDAQLDELDCREQYLIMQALVAAFDMRAHMLTSLGAQVREEQRQTGMQISEFKDTLRDTKRQANQEREKNEAARAQAVLREKGKRGPASTKLQDNTDELDTLNEDVVPF